MADGFTSLSTSQAIDAAVSARAMLSHAFYQAWSEGKLSLDTLRGYAGQYFHHVEAFPRAVSATHSACPDREGRRMLAENLAEEEGLGEGKDDHASLWMMFAEGLGATRDEVMAADLEPETEAPDRRLPRPCRAAPMPRAWARSTPTRASSPAWPRPRSTA